MRTIEIANNEEVYQRKYVLDLIASTESKAKKIEALESENAALEEQVRTMNFGHEENLKRYMDAMSENTKLREALKTSTQWLTKFREMIAPLPKTDELKFMDEALEHGIEQAKQLL